jgi:hypothetical protein
MGLDFFLNWVGRRVWIDDVPEASPRQGKIVHVYQSLLLGDLDLLVRMDDEAVTTVQVSAKGRSWDWNIN